MVQQGQSSLPWFLFFACVSISLVIVNKAVMQSFPYPMSLLIFQNGATILLNLGGTWLGVFEMKPWQLQHLLQFGVQSCMMACSLTLNLAGLPGTAVATLLVFKSLQVVLTAFLEWVLRIAVFSTQAYLCLGACLGGSLLYAWSDTYYDPSAYAILLLCIVINAAQQIYERGITVQVEQTPVGCSCYKNVMTLPVLLVSAASSGELQDMTQAVPALPQHILLLAVASAALGFGISLAYSSLNKLASSTSITVANNFNKLLTTMAAQVVFAEHIVPSAAAGLLLSLMSSVCYGLETRRNKSRTQETLGKRA